MTLKIVPRDFCVPEGRRVDLKKWPTTVNRAYKSKKEYHTVPNEQVDELTSMQRLHYASNGYAVLVIFQGMDAAGKDGAIRQVMSGVNPQGCQVFTFKQPSAEELEHDFLWRTTRRLPERGRIGIFDRSYYKEVLIVRVHLKLLAGQGLPDELLNAKTICMERYRSIVELENHLHLNGTRIIKIFLHESKDTQRNCAIVALAWANSPWIQAYFALSDTPVFVQIGTFSVALDLQRWINDGLMAIFLFVVALEIKREQVFGDLSDTRKAALPVVAAVGGMILPAGLYLALNFGGEGVASEILPDVRDSLDREDSTRSGTRSCSGALKNWPAKRNLRWNG